MYNEITIVISSRSPQNEKQDLIDNITKTCGYNFHIMFITNTEGVSLTTVYQGMLESTPNDLIVFMHDDIQFLKEGWGKELVRLFESHQDYGIIGVAGSADFDENAAWWRYKNIYGQVLHRHDGKSWLTAFSPLLKEDLQEVCVVDGLFFAVDRTRISKPFDKDFQGFNFYEISFCLANYVDKKTKIGVTTNIRIAHSSVGEMKPNWYENRIKLNDKYKQYYPIHVKK